MSISTKLGILLVNLGTPDAPTPAAVKRYLSQFLKDRRVVDTPRWLWYPLLHGVILPKRAPRVAKLYQAVWTNDGSPLMVFSKAQQRALSARLPKDIPVELAMTYGSPSVSGAVDRLMAQAVTKLVVLPLFPQYSGSTTGAVWDALSEALAKRRNLPEIHFIRDYAEHPQYIAALAESIRESFAEHGQPELLVFSYHGIPQRYASEGDDYPKRCKATTEAVVSLLGLSAGQYKMTYQSRFGKEPWLLPYTDETLKSLPEHGIKHIQVICPGFAVDCLETIEEIAVENKKLFLSAGGEAFIYIPALNATSAHINLLQQLATG